MYIIQVDMLNYKINTRVCCGIEEIGDRGKTKEYGQEKKTTKGGQGTKE